MSETISNRAKRKNLSSINTTDIQHLVADTALNCYGVVSLCKKSVAFGIVSIKTLKNQKAHEGVDVKRYLNGTIEVTIYINIAVGVKISEVLSECQKVILFTLNKKYGNSFCKTVNIYAEGICVNEEVRN